MTITAQQVKELREMTGAGMMDCKKALQETNGDIDGAIEILQKAGAAAAAKKAGRIAAEGIIGTYLSDDKTSGVISEINCETDFVARNEQFQTLVNTITSTIGTSDVTDIESLEKTKIPGLGKTVEEYTGEQINTIGEKITTRRFVKFTATNGLVADYIHAGGQIGVLVHVEGGNSEEVEGFARDVAMHIAAMNPPYLTADEIPADVRATRERILTEAAQESGKPAAIISKIVDGQIAKWCAESSLMSQPFVKDSDITIAQLQARYEGITIAGYARFEVGEGIERKQEKSLSEEVAEQLRSSK